MKRFVLVFVLLTATFVVLLGLKVRANQKAKLGPSGGSGIVEGQKVDLTSRIASRIREIRAKEGDRVAAGDILVVLDCEEPSAAVDAASARLMSSEHQAEAAKAQLEAAIGAAFSASRNAGAAGAEREALASNRDVTTKQVERTDRLRSGGGATELDFDRAAAEKEQLERQIAALDERTEAARGQARVARAQSEAARAQAKAAVNAIAAAQAELRRARALAAECVLIAPRAGEVETQALEVGEVVLPGSRVLTLVDTEDVDIDFYLPNRELAAAQPGRSVSIVADAYPDRAFKGIILRVSPEAEFTPRNVQTREDRDRLVYRVTVRASNPERALRPGMAAEVTVDGTGAPP